MQEEDVWLLRRPWLVVYEAIRTVLSDLGRSHIGSIVDANEVRDSWVLIDLADCRGGRLVESLISRRRDDACCHGDHLHSYKKPQRCDEEHPELVGQVFVDPVL